MTQSSNIFHVLPYKFASKSAKALASALGGKRIKPDNNLTLGPNDVVINWGHVGQAHKATLNNDKQKLLRATNKLLFFQHLKGAGLTPAFWTCKEDIPDEAFPVVCRTILNGHSGAGIVLAYVRSDLVDAPLYVQYVNKKHEYRIHVGKAGLISTQQKKRRLDHANPNWKIRNHANGFIYAREGVDPPSRVLHVAHDCLDRLDLDFGAVDVIWNESKEAAYVLEINTAPGLEGTTLDDYANYFRNLVA
jgi:glutathione synthase/RimK-type ligase-like ATP-grasp enzyme